MKPRTPILIILVLAAFAFGGTARADSFLPPTNSPPVTNMSVLDSWSFHNPSQSVSTGERFQAAGETAMAALPFLNDVRVVSGEFRAFSSFDAFKSAMGPAGEGRVWHHIVEQRAANVEKFGAEAIHNTENVVNVSKDVNQQIANYYSSIRPFTGGQTVRNWVGSQSYEQQMQFGSRILSRVANNQPLP